MYQFEDQYSNEEDENYDEDNDMKLVNFVESPEYIVKHKLPSLPSWIKSNMVEEILTPFVITNRIRTKC